MAVMLEKLYRALRAANVPEEEATAAATELAGYETRFSAIEGTQKLHTWMLGTIIALLVTVMFKVFGG